jgi:hypothetical protein
VAVARKLLVAASPKGTLAGRKAKGKNGKLRLGYDYLSPRGRKKLETNVRPEQTGKTREGLSNSELDKGLFIEVSRFSPVPGSQVAVAD